MSVRAMLQRSAERFRALQGKTTAPVKKEKARIEELFKTQVNLVKSKAALQAYSQDALMWFTQKLAEGIKGISVSKIAGHKWFSTKWTLGEQSIYFAFEGGDNSARWKVIAKEAIAIAKKDGAKMLVVFRTTDLATVPKSSWKAIGPTIEEARKVGLRIHPLEPTYVCEIHAARDLYSDALQGNVDEKPVDILAWLKTSFEPRVLTLFQTKPPLEPKPSQEGATAAPAMTTVLTSGQKTEILKFVEKRRWVPVDDVIKQLTLPISVELLLKGMEGDSI